MFFGGGHLGFPIGIKKQKLCRGPSNDHSWAVWFQLSRWFQRRSVLKNVSKRFFFETTWTIETKLPMNDHWKVLYKMFVFYADRKFKMATTAIHKLTLDPMRKCSNACLISIVQVVSKKKRFETFFP
jgi:hypothetical protein